MKKATSAFMVLVLFLSILTFRIKIASAEDLSIFYLYPLTKNNVIDENEVVSRPPRIWLQA